MSGEIIDPVRLAARILSFSHEIILELGVVGEVDAAAVALAAALSAEIDDFIQRNSRW